MKQALKLIGIIFLLVGAVCCVFAAADFYEKRLKRCYYAANLRRYIIFRSSGRIRPEQLLKEKKG